MLFALMSSFSAVYSVGCSSQNGVQVDLFEFVHLSLLFGCSSLQLRRMGRGVI